MSTMVPRRSAQWSRQVRWSRHAVQSVLVIWVGWLIYAKATAGPGQPSPESFCPFGGFETAWTYLTTGRTVPHVHTANLVLAGIVVVLALFGRGFFCGWLCPLGSIQEGIRAAAHGVVQRVPWMRRTGRQLRGRMTWWPRTDHLLRYFRYAVLAWALIGAAITGVMVFREVDPWAALLSVVEFEISTAFAVLLIVLVWSLFLDRPFCRYACPLGAIQGLIGKASPVAIQRNADACLGCSICNDACPMALPVNQRTRVTDSTCIGCLECVAACPSREALSLTVTFPTRAEAITIDTDQREDALR